MSSRSNSSAPSVDEHLVSMRTLWKRLSVRAVDQRIFGRTIRAFAHPAGFLLLHHKFVSRSSRYYRTSGSWLLCTGGEIVARMIYLNSRPITQPPIRWANAKRRANQILRDEPKIGHGDPVG